MTSTEEFVVLVDESDTEIGTMEKLQAHRSGRLHRAFSVFVLDSTGRVLLQRRASAKYHSGGLWSNSCCGHPRPGESVSQGARRRLREEMGLDCELTPVDSFVYFAQLEDGLTEHEFDHVFIGYSDAGPRPDPGEVGEWQWVHPEHIEEQLEVIPGDYTAWFAQAFRVVRQQRNPPRT